MKVLHLIGGGDTGGAKTHVLNLLRELNSHIDARLVCFRQGEFSQDAKKMGIPIDVIESGSPVTGLKELKKLLAKEQVDIIHCHGARGNLMGNMIKKYLKAPVVTTVHSDYRLDYLGRPVAMLSYGATNMLALRRVNYYIGVAAPMTDILIERKFPADRIYTIYNGIDFKTPFTYQSREDYLRSLGLSWGEDVVIGGIAARLSPVKDIPTLLRAMAIACEKAPNLRVILAGDGEDREKLKAMTKELGLTDRVCFAGWVSDMNSFYHALDLNLLTSVSETFPYALTEGARMGLPTIASRVGGVPVLIDEGENGFIFTPGKEQELAGHLITLALDGEKRRTMGKALFEKASTLFSIDSMVKTQLEIYDSILLRSRRDVGKRDGVVICGAYGHGNFGDDAILQSIIHSVREMDEAMPITVLAKNTMSIKKRYHVQAAYSFNLWKMGRIMRKSRLYINGGGTLIQNATSQRSLWYYLFTLYLAKKLGNAVCMYGCGIGPVKGKSSISLVRKVLNRCVDSITLREKDSLEELTRFGVDQPFLDLSSDPALVLSPGPEEKRRRCLENHGLDPEGKYLCLMIRDWEGMEEKAEIFAQAADYCYRQYGLTTVFLPLNPKRDTFIIVHAVIHMESDYHLEEEFVEPEEMITFLSGMELCIGMRLHGLIFSSLSGVPLIGVAYDPKINSFLDYLGYGDHKNLEDLTIEWLIAAIDRAMDPQAGDQASRLLFTQRLQQLERKNIQAVQRLLEKGEGQ